MIRVFSGETGGRVTIADTFIMYSGVYTLTGQHRIQTDIPGTIASGVIIINKRALAYLPVGYYILQVSGYTQANIPSVFYYDVHIAMRGR